MAGPLQSRDGIESTKRHWRRRSHSLYHCTLDDCYSTAGISGHGVPWEKRKGGNRFLLCSCGLGAQESLRLEPGWDLRVGKLWGTRDVIRPSSGCMDKSMEVRKKAHSPPKGVFLASVLVCMLEFPHPGSTISPAGVSESSTPAILPQHPPCSTYVGTSHLCGPKIIRLLLVRVGDSQGRCFRHVPEECYLGLSLPGPWMVLGLDCPSPNCFEGGNLLLGTLSPLFLESRDPLTNILPGVTPAYWAGFQSFFCCCCRVPEPS